jgi:hypothetical protein
VDVLIPKRPEGVYTERTLSVDALNVCEIFAVPVTIVTSVFIVVATLIFAVFDETAVRFVTETEFETKTFPRTLMALPNAKVPTPMFEAKRVKVFMVATFIRVT